MEKNSNALNWFEIPAADINRAKKFYGTIFNSEMVDMGEQMGMKMASFPNDMQNHVSGGLVEGPNHKPSAEGAVVYLNGNPDLQKVLDRIPAAGGQVVVPKMEISKEIGHMAFFIDSEGNKVGLHSNN
jgi:predicted enzyme related to lactoylglutathione lyase